MRKKIAVDLCGADASPYELARGAVRSLAEQKEYDLILAGPAAEIRRAIEDEAHETAEDDDDIYLEESFEAMMAELDRRKEYLDRVEVLDTAGVMTQEDALPDLIHGKEETTMAQAFAALASRDEVAGMVSAGDTGAMLIGSIFRLGLLGTLKQPALGCLLYKKNGGFVALCDCGANVNCRTEDLVLFAQMGSAFMEAACGVAEPAVGLINVGEEEGKGSDLTKGAYEELKAADTVRFIGNIEGSDILSGKADVAVCDGFTGNVLLKSLEAAGLLAAEMMGNPPDVVRFFDYNSQAGAVFLGTRKILVKAHGAATGKTVASCIAQACRLDRGGFTQKMGARLS